MSLYSCYDDFYRKYPDLYGPRAGGKNRAKTARRVSGKFAPNDPGKPFKVDPTSHSRAGKVGGRKRKAQVDVLGLRDERGRFLPKPEGNY